MATQKQIEANRRNAQKSTGPTSALGKYRSRANALKHGMAALHCPLAHEDTESYHTMRAGLVETYQPANTQELMLVDNIASAWVQMQRAERFEASLMSTFIEDMKFRTGKENTGPWKSDDTGVAILMTDEKLEQGWAVLDRYQRRSASSYYRAIEALRKVQAERRRKVVDEIREHREREKYMKETTADPSWKPEPMPDEAAQASVTPINATKMGSFGRNEANSFEGPQQGFSSPKAFRKEGKNRRRD